MIVLDARKSLANHKFSLSRVARAQIESAAKSRVPPSNAIQVEEGTRRKTNDRKKDSIG